MQDTFLFIYNHFHNILRLLNVLPDFPLTASETMRNSETWYILLAPRVVKQLKTYNLKKLGNIRKKSKLHRMIA